MIDIDIGRRLKSLRKTQNLTLQEVAEASELSKSFVSQVENGAAQPSIGSLKRITDVLGVTLADLFQEEEGESSEADNETNHLVRIVKKDKRKHLEWPNGAQAALLTPDLQGKLEVILTTYNAESEETVDPYMHEGEELGFVLEGTFEVRVNDVTYVLEAGDSIYFPSHLPHSTKAAGDTPVKTIWVITPPSF